MNRYNVAVCITGFIVALGLIAFGIWKYTYNLYNVLDLAIYSQAAWDLIHSHSLINSIQGASYFGDHVELFLFPVSLLYAIFAHPIMLVGIQIMVILSGAMPIYAIAKRLTTERIACVTAIAFLLHPLVWNASLFEFHLLTFAIPLLLWMLYAYTIRSYAVFILFLFLSLAVREDVALVIFGMGILALADKRSLRWWATPFILSAAWFIGALIVNAQFADHGYKFFVFYSWLGSSIQEIIQTLIFHPWYIISHLFTASNILFPIALLLLFVGLPLRGLRGIIPTVFIFLQLLLGLFNVKTLLTTHYTALLIPFLAYASILGIQRIQKMQKEKRALIPEFRRMIALIGVLVFVINFFAIGPILGFWAEKNNGALTLAVPKDASVLASYGPITRVSARSEVYSLHYFALGHKQFSDDPYLFTTQPEYVFLDLEDLTTFEYQYATNAIFQKDFDAMPDRLRTFFDDYTVTKRAGQEFVLQPKNETNSSASQILASVTNEPSREGTKLFDIQQINQLTDATLGAYLDIQFSLTPLDANAWRQLALVLSWNDNKSEQKIEAPIAWHLYSLPDPKKTYNVRMFIPLNSQMNDQTELNVSLIKRSGRLEIAAHRGTQTSTETQELIANQSVMLSE